MIGLLAAALVSGGVTCAPPPGMDALLDLDRRFIVVGETHGTAETPAAFAEMVCAASERGPVTVALERPQNEQSYLDAFLAAETDEAAVAALAGSDFMDLRFADGRTSRSMLAMMQSVRRLRQAGRDVAIHAFVPTVPERRGLSQAYGELEMGRGIAIAAYRRREAKILVLVGNLHARKTPVTGLPFDIGVPAAGHLPPLETITLYVPSQGGETWSCRGGDACGVNRTAVAYDPDIRGVLMGDAARPALGGRNEGAAYDGILALGPTTASSPAAEDGAP